MKNYINMKNNTGIKEFDGLSPVQMDLIINYLFESNGIIKIHEKIREDVLAKIPFLQQVKYYLEILKREGEIKLTKAENLPPKIVKEIYAQGIIKDDAIERGITKLTKETDSLIIQLTRIIPEISGLCKKRNNTLSLTKNGLEIIEDENKLFKLIFINFSKKYNWGFPDKYEDKGMIQKLMGYTLYLLNKYGDQFRTVQWYFDQFNTAFPDVADAFNEFEDRSDSEFFLFSCYQVRTFERFLNYFNMIDYEDGKYESFGKNKIKTTEIFREIIKI